MSMIHEVSCSASYKDPSLTDPDTIYARKDDFLAGAGP